MRINLRRAGIFMLNLNEKKNRPMIVKVRYLTGSNCGLGAKDHRGFVRICLL